MLKRSMLTALAGLSAAAVLDHGGSFRSAPINSKRGGAGAVRITPRSGLRKLMRAARRGLVPAERLGAIVRAMGRASVRSHLYLSAHVRGAILADLAAQQDALTEHALLYGDTAVPL